MSEPSNRLQLVLSQKEMDRVRRIKEKSGASSKSAAIRDALDLYDFIVEELEAGGKLYSVKVTEEGIREEKRILVLF